MSEWLKVPLSKSGVPEREPRVRIPPSPRYEYFGLHEKVSNYMKTTKPKLKICSRGHKFYKSSDCPVCPTCWSGYFRKKVQSDFPEKLSAPALRALHNAKITKLKQLSKFTEAEISKLHGVGPKALNQLRKFLQAQNITFKIESNKKI